MSLTRPGTTSGGHTNFLAGLPILQVVPAPQLEHLRVANSGAPPLTTAQQFLSNLHHHYT
jgi:hypothetical protein